MVFGHPQGDVLGMGVMIVMFVILKTKTQNSPPFVHLVSFLEYQPSFYRAYQRSDHKYPLLSSKMRDLIFSEFWVDIILSRSKYSYKYFFINFYFL